MGRGKPQAPDPELLESLYAFWENTVSIQS